jgi:hypothetical protein
MSKRIDFVKGLKDLGEVELKARIQEDQLRNLLILFPRWKTL